MFDAVDLIEGQIIFHQAAEFPEAGLRISDKCIHQPPVSPAVVLLGKCQRVLVVQKRHHRFDAVLLTFFKDLPVKPHALFIDRLLFSFWKQTRPLDGKAQAVESLLGAEADILFPVMIEIRGDMGGIVILLIVDQARHRAFGKMALRAPETKRGGAAGSVFLLPCHLTAHRMRTVGHDIGGRESRAVLKDASFILIRGCGAAP